MENYWSEIITFLVTLGSSWGVMQNKIATQQMSIGADILKDIASADKSLSKACYYESKSDWSDDKKY